MRRDLITISGVVDYLAKDAPAEFESTTLAGIQFRPQRSGPNINRWLEFNSRSIGILDNNLSFAVGELERNGLPARVVSLKRTDKQAMGIFNNGLFDPTRGWLYRILLEVDRCAIQGLGMSEVENSPGIYKIRVDLSRRGSHIYMPENLMLRASGEPLFFEYIGQSRNVAKRRERHLAALTRSNHPNDGLAQLWRTHGEEAFIFSMIERAPSDLAGIELALWLGASEYLHLRESRNDKSVVNLNIAEPEIVFQGGEHELFEDNLKLFADRDIQANFISAGLLGESALTAIKSELSSLEIKISADQSSMDLLRAHEKKSQSWFMRPFISREKVRAIEGSILSSTTALNTLRRERAIHETTLQAHYRASRRISSYRYVVDYYLTQNALGAKKSLPAGARARRYVN
jgi:hypothetical protein